MLWGGGEEGSLNPRLERPEKDSQGNVTGWVPVTISNAPSIGILSVSTRTPLPINGTSTIDLPLCGGAQSLTLTVPQEYFGGAPNVPIIDYVWEVPSNLNVQNGQQAPGFSAGYWLSGRSITVTAPAGQLNTSVRVVMWSRMCNQNSAFNNPPATLISFPRNVTLRRVPPTITSVTASSTSLTCGDQRPVTLTATLNQNGGTTTYNWPDVLPNGWTYQTPAPRTGPSVVVIPSGTPGTVSVSVNATYSCGGGGTTPQVSVSVNVSSQVAAPTVSPSLSPDANGKLAGLCSPTAYTVFAPGATSYQWTTSGGILVNGGTVAGGSSVTLSPGAGVGTGSVTIQALNPSNNCTANSTTYTLTYGVPPVRDIVTLQGYCFDYAANGPNSSFLVCPSENLAVRPALYNYAGQGYDGRIEQYEWQMTGGTDILTNSGSVFYFTSSAQPGQSATLTLRLRNSCGWSDAGTFSFTTLNQNGGEEPFRTAPTKTAAYPNPADATLTLEQPAGTSMTIFNAQGKTIYSGKADKHPVQVATCSWPEGLYYLHTRTGKATQRHQIQIKH